MKYMLDTNILIYAGKKEPKSVIDRLLMCTLGEACISSITLAEMEYGIENSIKKKQNRLALLTILSGLEVLPFGDSAAMRYGEIRAEMEKRGILIGPNNLLIAAHASSEGLVLVTNNEKEFRKVKGLQIENWTKF